MPRRLSDLDLRRHVGARFAKRARRSRVEEPTVEGDVLAGRVGLYEVQVTLGERVQSRCSCIYGERCEHVGALLAGWIDEPSRFAVRAAAIPLPTSPNALRSWLETNDPAVLTAPVDDFIDRGRWMSPRHPLWSANGRDLDTALDMLAMGVERGQVSESDAIQPLHSAVTDLVRSRERRRTALQEASGWRDSPPAEAVLRPFYAAARVHLPVEVLTKRPPGAFGRAQLLPSGDVRFVLTALPYHPVTLPLGAAMLDTVTGLAVREVAGVLLDSIVGHHQPDVRLGVLSVLAVPPWQRALEQLDKALALEGPKSAPSLGWRVRVDGASVRDVQLVTLRPYVRREGYRTKRATTVTGADLPLAADRAALAASKANEPVEVVLEQLEGHPRVVDEQGQLVVVRRSTLEVAVAETEGFAVDVLVDGRPVVSVDLQAARSSTGIGVLHQSGTIHLVRVGPVVDGLLGILQRFGTTFPAEARGPLLERLGLLDRAVPLRLAGTLQGTQVERDDRPLLLLEPHPDGALQVLVRLEPLAGGALVVPGEGAGELSVTVDGVRHFIRRDLSAEVARVEAALEALPMPDLMAWEGVLPRPDDALALVWALRTREDVRSLWPKKRLVVKGEATASQVRASAQRRRDWFGIEGEVRSGESSVGLSALLRAIRTGQRFVQLDDGGWLRLADGLRKALRSAAQIGTDEEVPRLPPLAAARAMLALEEAGGDTVVPDELVDLGARIRAADTLKDRVPKGLQATLRDYQQAGVTWLRRLSTWAPGAVLADEMGLGKTLQSLALILERRGPTLVVAPASVNLNWQREAERFTPELRVELYRGKERHGLLDDPTIDVWVTSYELLARDVHTLSDRRFTTVIFDEAQALKNPRTKRARAARALDVGFTLSLTGTPIENNLLELWSLMRVTVPGLLGPKEHFHERFGKKQMAASSMGNGNLGSLVRPFLLRRTKRAVAPELPERTDTVDWVELSSRERVAYDRLRMAAVSALAGEERGDRMAVLAALTRLRQVACADRLIDPEAPALSTKLIRMLEIIEATVADGGALLVFSQFTSLLDLAQQATQAKGLRVVRLDGSTSLTKRQRAVDSFQAGDADVFFISLKAGGTGLNLTTANTVIHLDPWWNPAAEDQASDRAHRIGQKRAVQIIRLVSAGTVEEQVLAMHADKRRLADQLFEGTAGSLAMRSDDLLKLLGADD